MRKTIAILMVSLPLLAAGQQERSSKKNVVKFVATPNLFYDDAFVLGYERVFKLHQSLNVAAGVISLPAVFDGTHLVRADEERSRGGFMAAADYRFYLQKENKFGAPRGVYLAPFLSYYHLEGDWALHSTSSTTPSDATMHGELAFINIGGQIGYQFIVKDRFTFDFIFFGPSITNYKLGLDLQGKLTVDEENEVVQAVLARFPLLNQVIDDKDVTVHGTNSTWSGGYRFTFMFGYTFGRNN